MPKQGHDAATLAALGTIAASALVFIMTKKRKREKCVLFPGVYVNKPPLYLTAEAQAKAIEYARNAAEAARLAKDPEFTVFSLQIQLEEHIVPGCDLGAIILDSSVEGHVEAKRLRASLKDIAEAAIEGQLV